MKFHLHKNKKKQSHNTFDFGFHKPNDWMLEDLRVLAVPCAATIQSTRNFAVHTKFFDQAFNPRLLAPLKSGAASPLEWLFTRTRCPFSCKHTTCFTRSGCSSHAGSQNSSMELKKRGSDTTVTGQIKLHG